MTLQLGLGFSGADDQDMGDNITVLDTTGVDWSRVRRSAYAIHQTITYEYEGPVRRLRQRLMVQPREQHGDQRRVARHVRVVDATPRRVRSSADDFGNHVVDIDVPYVADRVSFISWSVVERHTGLPHLAAAASLVDPRLLEPTRLTAPDEALCELAADLRRTCPLGEDLAVEACARVFSLMAYAANVTGVRTTAAEAFAQRSGVCQDFAHVLLAITRCLGLPSRYVSGQMLGVGGSHAWVEVLVPTGDGHARVLSLDPTHGRRTGMTYVTIAVGRDYAHVAPLSGTYVASHAGVLSISKRVTVMSIDSDGLTDVSSSAGEERLAG
ncbi:MAG: transglutaminase family protein [Candidatus Dormibacteraeota bacterium]|uniref:Transglutaminase family protein n=1 Tax=Candidatus Amunia macphersoniae TaxID=3127014 RepID=A0A934KMA4_9BACT|nr:transglutaminase family protein [Candidatus Dormibacteraeota bacterium]